MQALELLVEAWVVDPCRAILAAWTTDGEPASPERLASVRRDVSWFAALPTLNGHAGKGAEESAADWMRRVVRASQHLD